MKLPQLQIHSTPAKIGIRSEQGYYDIKRSEAKVEIKTVDAVVDIHSEQAVVLIDQSKMWDAITGGKPQSFWNRIYNQSGQYVSKAIKQTVQDYDRIGDILASGNPVADIAKESLSSERPPLKVFGPAAYDNVTFNAVISEPEINVQRGFVDINVQITKPQINFHRGKVSIYMEQYPSVNITAPRIDLEL